MSWTVDADRDVNANDDAAGADATFEHVRDLATDRFTTDADQIVFARAPGRVNLIGDHTDYNDGFVLPATIDRAIYVALRRRPDPTARLHSINFEETIDCPLGEASVDRYPEWARYVIGVAAELNEVGTLQTGFEAVLYGDVPLGAGLSSSAALEVATAIGIDALYGVGLAPDETATLCQRVEHEYVGVQCGIMDQMASRMGRAGHALFLDCRSLEHEHIPLPLDETSILIADTKVSRGLASSKYTERRAECEEGASYFRQIDPDIRALRDVSRALFQQHKTKLPDPVRSRCRHVISENERVRQSARELQEANVRRVGELMSRSHESLRDDYEVSIAELDHLVDTARNTDGVYGARMTGAGFGGCAVCLARKDAIPELKQRLSSRFADRFGHSPSLFVVDENIEATTLRWR